MNKLLIAFMAILLFEHSSAQNISSLKRSSLLDAPTEELLRNDVELFGELNDKNQNEWVVLSDRDSNIVYDDSSFYSNKSKSVSFLKPLIVFGESKNFIYVGDYRAWNKNKTVSIYGWLPKKNVLLWPLVSLKDQRSGIIIKGMVIYRLIDSMLNDIGDNPRILSFRRMPNVTSTYTEHRANTFEYYHIFKYDESRKWALLGKSPALNGNLIGNDLENSNQFVGWAPLTRILEWSSRIVIEPNYVSTAVKERKEKRIKATIFDDQASSELFERGISNNSSIIWDDDSWEFMPWPAERRRLPVLNLSSTNVLHTGSIQPVTIGDDTLDHHVISSRSRLMNKLIAKARNINIVFVLDGTSNMSQHFKAVQDAIVSTIKEINTNKKNTGNRFKFGAVIYRDYSSSERKVEYYPLQGQNDVVGINRLVNVFLDPIKSRPQNQNDIKRGERGDDKYLFGGLSKAYRDVLQLNTDETNVVILLGSTGNKIESTGNKIIQTEMKELIDFMRVYEQPHFIGFQINYLSERQYYPKFSSDLLSLFDSVGRKLVDTLRNIKQDNIIPSYKNIIMPDGYIVDNTTFYGRIFSLNDERRTISQEQIVNGILESIDSIDNMTTELVVAMKKFERSGKWVVKPGIGSRIMNLGMINKLRKHGMRFLQQSSRTDEEIQVFADGYTSYKVENMESPLYRFELFLSDVELMKGLILPLEKMVTALKYDKEKGRFDIKSEEEACKGLYNVMLELCKTFAGSVSTSEIDNMTVSEFMRQISGFPYRSTLMQNVRIRDIINCSPNVRSQMTAFVDYLEFKKSLLYKVFKEPDGVGQMHFISNETKYFWIDETFIP